MSSLDDLLTAADAAMTAVHNLHGDLGPDHDAPWHKHEAAFRKLDAALTDIPEPDAHKPGDPHHYQLTCKVCGENGTLWVLVDPQTADEEAPQ